MKFNEFKAWLEGFNEAFTNGYPNKKQWLKIKERLENIDFSDSPIVIREYERYPYPYRPWWPTWWTTDIHWTYGTSTTNTYNDAGVNVALDNYNVDSATATLTIDTVMLCNAAKEIGRQEAKQLEG